MQFGALFIPLNGPKTQRFYKCMSFVYLKHCDAMELTFGIFLNEVKLHRKP